MKKISAFLSSVFDIIVFVLCLALIGIGGFSAFALFGAGAEVGGQDNASNLGPLEAALVKGTQGFLTGLVVLFAVVALTLTLAAIAFAVFNLQSSVSCFSFIKNGAFKNHKQQNKVRAAMGCDFMLAFTMILAYIFLIREDTEGIGTLLTVCLVGGIISLIGASCKIPLVKERIKPPRTPYNPNNPTNRW